MLTFDDDELVGAVGVSGSYQDVTDVDRVGAHLISFCGRPVVQSKIAGQSNVVW